MAFQWKGFVDSTVIKVDQGEPRGTGSDRGEPGGTGGGLGGDKANGDIGTILQKWTVR